MNFTPLIDTLIVPLVTGFAVAARLSNPTATTPDLTQTVEGEIKHYLRGKIGFMVDFLWSDSQFKSALDSVITQALGSAAPAFPTLLPPSGAGGQS